MTGATGANAYILFTVAGTTYALSSDDVRHMEMIDQITPVPNGGDSLDGVVLSRGQIVPVLNLRARFGFERAPYDVRTRLLIVQSADRSVGLVADSAREFVRIPRAAIQPPSSAITNLSANYLEGVATVDDRLILVLNVASVLDTSGVSRDAADDSQTLAGAAARHTETPV